MSNSEEYEDSISMMDVLHEQEAMEEDAEAVLGGADEDICTYSQGYKRQPLYACKTCTPGGIDSNRAAVCLACANYCHKDHTIVELFTKRNFRCDCGNSKFTGKNKCTLNSEKDQSNEKNKYNQNFDGVYCTCHRPYPDTEHPENDEEMIQCISCEDWYHAQSHLGGNAMPDSENFGEMICPECVNRLPFLENYAALQVICEKDAKENLPGSTVATTEEKKDDTNLVKKVDADKGCSVGSHKGILTKGAALFLPDGWRDNLCTCETCKNTYENLSCSFLLDNEDTISYYEQRSKEKSLAASNGRSSRELSAEREINALNKVDRITRTEMVAEYNTLSTELREYLRKFAESGKVVRDDDIKEFFSGLQARKKRRGNDGMPPNNCGY